MSEDLENIKGFFLIYSESRQDLIGFGFVPEENSKEADFFSTFFTKKNTSEKQLAIPSNGSCVVFQHSDFEPLCFEIEDRESLIKLSKQKLLIHRDETGKNFSFIKKDRDKERCFFK